jgi:riboflavin biosynthesis pyrimidine reductase
MRDGDDLRSAFVELGRLGVRRISVVGGRTIARALVRAGLVQDLYLTTAAKSGGEPGTPLFAKPVASSVVLRKRGTGPDDGVKFEQLAFGQA